MFTNFRIGGYTETLKFKPESNTLEACSRLALIEGQKENKTKKRRKRK